VNLAGPGRQLIHRSTPKLLVVGAGERYFNHLVDRFDLRRHTRFNARIVAEEWGEGAVSWIVRAGDGLEVQALADVSAKRALAAVRAAEQSVEQ
jgi:hypothetical protein